MRFTYKIFIFLQLGVSVTCYTQTSNDNMTEAEVLFLNQPVSSKTHGNTVQYNCINTKLTGKCIKYHNDQWYTFTADGSSNLYVNISGQSCRDLRGVQLVVFSGELCSPDTYDLIDCISLATQDDIHVALRNLAKGRTYWLNVDGYLHDFCSYRLEVSHKPKGFSSQKTNLLDQFYAKENGNKLTIQWQLPDSLAHLASETQLLRRHSTEFKYVHIADNPFQINAFGHMEKSYSYTDEVFQPGTYHFRLALPLNSEELLLLDEIEWTAKASNLKRAYLDLDYENNDELEVVVSDASSSKQLDKFTLFYDPQKHSSFPIYVDRYLGEFKQLEVKIYNRDQEHTAYHYIDLSTLKSVKFR